MQTGRIRVTKTEVKEIKGLKSTKKGPKPGKKRPAD